MKLLSKTIFFCFLWLSCINSFAQYVRLEGKQFKVNGTNFYPIVMNYNIGITHNQGTGDYYATPSGSYGPLSYYECNDATTCNARFQIDFAKLVSMGYNAIRFGLGPIYREGAIAGSRVFSTQFNDNLGSNQWMAPTQNRDLSFPNFNDQASIDFFNILIDILNQADIAGLKVILLTSGTGPKNQNGVPLYYPVYDQQASDDYSIYLGKLASVLANHPALLAYDLFNEPIYGQMYYGFPSGVRTEWAKQDICSFEKQWYDAIKPLNDPNHLVTIGGASTDEVFYWDMGNLKLDFYSLHAYPDYNKFQFSTDIQASIQAGRDKFKNIVYWMGQVCPMPWIIGETGFSADDNTSPHPLNVIPVPHVPPYMYGSELQQQQFAQQSLNEVRNAGASGYSWWAFQNVYWFDENSPPPYWPYGMPEDFFGLLHYGDGINNWFDKTVVTNGIFQNYLTNGQPPAVVPLQEPANYHDPFNIHAALNTNATNAISGYVYDDKGKPIKDAVVYGANWLWTDNTVPLNPKYNFDSPFTFTDANGYFEIVPYNYYQPGAINPHRIVNIRITAVGAERHCEGSCNWPFGQVPMTQTSFPSIAIKKITTGFDAIASNETVNSGETRNYYGWNSLTASNLTLKGNSVLTARNEIQINSEFHASKTSEVHIFPSDAYPDCDDFIGFTRTANPVTFNQENEQTSSKEIEIKFDIIKDLKADIFPNPSNGIFTVVIQNPLQNSVEISVLNLLGEKVYKTATNQTEYLANFDYLAKGIYTVHISNEKQILNKKIIIN